MEYEVRIRLYQYRNDDDGSGGQVAEWRLLAWVGGVHYTLLLLPASMKVIEVNIILKLGQPALDRPRSLIPVPVAADLLVVR